MKLLYFIVSHSLFIAFCAAALCFQTAVLLKISLTGWFYSLIFFSTICSYNFYWLLSSYSFAPKKIVLHLKSHLSNSIVFFLSVAGVIISLFQLPEITTLVTIGAVLTFLYAIPLLPFKWALLARKAGLLKTTLLAFTWSYITVFIPYKYAETGNITALILLFFIRFVFMLMLCIIFDARDARVDKIRGLQSLTTMLSAKMVKMIMLLLFAAFLIAGIFFRIHFNEIRQVLSLLVTGLAVAIAYYYSLKKQGYYFYYFIIDGLMLFGAAATYIASIK